MYMPWALTLWLHAWYRWPIVLELRLEYAVCDNRHIPPHYVCQVSLRLQEDCQLRRKANQCRTDVQFCKRAGIVKHPYHLYASKISLFKVISLYSRSNFHFVHISYKIKELSYHTLNSIRCFAYNISTSPNLKFRYLMVSSPLSLDVH